LFKVYKFFKKSFLDKKLNQYFFISPLIKVGIKKSLRAKKIGVSINRSTFEVSLVVPKYQTIKDAKKFIFTQKDWIEKTLKKLQDLSKLSSRSKQISCREKLEKLTNAEIHLLSMKLIQRCQLLAKNHKFEIGKVSIRNQKTRWGSCSGKNNISLNINLSFLGQELIDYVIFHELTHIKNKNHSKKFWQDLEEVCCGSKLMDKELRNFKLA
jgi:predicted metal-dependent hydrolase